MKNKLPNWRWVATAIALATQASWANEEAALPIVKVVGHYDLAVGTSDAASQGSVKADLIRNRPALRTGELLEFVPGMIVTQHSGDGKANQYFLRGYNLDHGTDFATYVDAMPVNMRTHAHGQGYSDMNFLIAELVQRIDYKKGPYFADEGDFASAGAARLLLADSLDSGILSISAGGNGYRRALLADSFDAGAGHLLYAIEAHRNRGPWLMPENTRKANGMLRYSQGNAEHGFKLTAMAYHNTWNATDQIPQRAVQSGALERFGHVDATDGGQASRTSVSFAHSRRNAHGRFELDAYTVQSSLDLFSNFTYFLANPDDGDQFEQSERRQMSGLNLSQSWTGTLGKYQVDNKLGLQARYDHIAPIGLYQTAARERLSTVREDRVDEASVGLYGEQSIQWMPLLRTVAGVRLDSYRFDVASNIAGNTGKASEQIVSPKLSVIVGPWHDTEFFANAGSGFHSNDARGTTQTRLADGSPSSRVTALVGTRGAELGVRTQWLPGLQSSLALWGLRSDSELVFIGDAGDTEASRGSRRSGIEWNNHALLAPGVLFDLDLAASRARYSDLDPAGQHIPGSLDKVASMGLTLTDIGPWSGALQLRYFGPRPLVEDNSVRSSSTALAYARLGYRINRSTQVSLDVFNLLEREASDIEYLYESRLRGEAPEGVRDLHFHPVEPRSMRLTLVHHF